MGFCNSPSYVQRQVDKSLRPYRAYARGYIDDIVIFSKTLKEYLLHLDSILKLLAQQRITLHLKTTFLGYPSAVLLGQRVQRLGLRTSDEKLAALANLQFPATLKQLATCLGMTG